MDGVRVEIRQCGRGSGWRARWWGGAAGQKEEGWGGKVEGRVGKPGKDCCGRCTSREIEKTLKKIIARAMYSFCRCVEVRIISSPHTCKGPGECRGRGVGVEECHRIVGML